MASHLTPSVGAAGGSQRSYRQIFKGMLEWLNQYSWVLLPVVAIPAFWPFVSIGLTSGSDTQAAVLRLAMLDHQMRGACCIRALCRSLLRGLLPHIQLFSLVSFYMGEMFHSLGLDYSGAVVATFIALMLIGGFGAYLLARGLFAVTRVGLRCWQRRFISVLPISFSTCTCAVAFRRLAARRWCPGLSGAFAAYYCGPTWDLCLDCGSELGSAGRRTYSDAVPGHPFWRAILLRYGGRAAIVQTVWHG